MNNYAFIDGNNLYYGAKTLNFKIDFLKFRQYLAKKHHVKKAFYFMGWIESYKALYKHLNSQGYDLIFRETVYDFKTGKHKGNCDSELILNSMIEYPNYDKAVIVSSDGDFSCLVKYLEEQEKLKTVIGVRKKFSKLLKKSTQKSYFLRRYKRKNHKIEMPYKITSWKFLNELYHS